MPDAVIRPFDNWRGLSKGYISRPEVLPPDTRAIRFSGRMSSVELANVIKAAINLSKLGKSSIMRNVTQQVKSEK